MATGFPSPKLGQIVKMAAKKLQDAGFTTRTIKDGAVIVALAHGRSYDFNPYSGAWVDRADAGINGHGAGKLIQRAKAVARKEGAGDAGK